MNADFDYFWRVKKTLPERFGQACRLIARGRGGGPHNVLVEFADGQRVVGSRFAIRRKR